jgi:hypothetical protein
MDYADFKKIVLDKIITNIDEAVCLKTYEEYDEFELLNMDENLNPKTFAEFAYEIWCDVSIGFAIIKLWKFHLRFWKHKPIYKLFAFKELLFGEDVVKIDRYVKKNYPKWKWKIVKKM